MEEGDWGEGQWNWSVAPEPVLLQVFSLLGARQLAAAAGVCTAWRRLATDHVLWRRLLRRDFVLPASPVSTVSPLRPGAISWYEEYKRLYCDVPIIQSQCLDSHSHQVLHVSFSHNGSVFATTSKDGTVMVWHSSYPCKLKYQRDMKEFSWKYTQFSQFNFSDTLLLVSGVHFGSLHSTSGEIAVFSLQNEFLLQCRVVNKPYDVFGCWIGEHHLISGELHWLAHLTSASILWVNKASQEPDSEHTPIIAPLYKFYNPNASSVRRVMIADCKWNKNEDNWNETETVQELTSTEQNCSSNDNPPSIKYKSEYIVSQNVPAESLDEQSNSESDSGSWSGSSHDDDLKNKLLIFTTGADTYTPHQIGFKKIDKVEFPKKLSPGPSIKERLALRERELEQERDGHVENQLNWLDFDSVKDKFNKPDKIIDLHGHIIGMALSPDDKFLYVNSRPWPTGYTIENPLNPPPIAAQIDIHVIDLTNLAPVGNMLRAHKSYTSNNECYFIFLDVSDLYVASGAEDNAAYIWDRFYGVCLAQLPHHDCVNAIAFNPIDPHMCVTVSDDYSIRVWRSRSSVKQLRIGGRGQRQGTAYCNID